MAKDSGVTRRRVLKSAASLAAAAAVPGTSAARPVRQRGAPSGPSANVTGRLARYMAEARDRDLPPEVARDARHRILDTLGAIISGARMKPAGTVFVYTNALSMRQFATLYGPAACVGPTVVPAGVNARHSDRPIVPEPMAQGPSVAVRVTTTRRPPCRSARRRACSSQTGSDTCSIG